MNILKFVFTCILVFVFSHSVLAQELNGSWEGTLEVMGQKLPLQFHFTPDGDDWKGTMDSPAQSARGIVINKVLFNGMLLSLEIKMAGITYEGVWIGDGFKGTFKQGGMELPLDLNRMDGSRETARPVRPQTPQPPFDYEIIETNFRNLDAGGIRIYGTLTKPSGNGKFPAVILVTGSGPQNRNSEIFDHQSFWVIADYFTRRGIAVLRYDERGVGESEGDFGSATSVDFKNDAQQAVAHLRKFPWIDQTRVGVVGHSEGGLISWMMAAEGEGINYILALAGPVVPIPELMAKQTADVSRSSGNPQDLIERQVAINSKLYQVIAESNSLEDAKAQIDQLSDKLLAEYGIEGELLHQQSKALKDAFGNSLNPWFYNFIKTDPEKYISRIKIPVFAAFGEKDVQVNAAQNANRLQELLESQRGQLELKIYPNLNHLFQNALTGAVSEYVTLEETFSEEVLDDMVRFIMRN
jgi:uncharacterized protein